MLNPSEHLILYAITNQLQFSSIQVVTCCGVDRPENTEDLERL